jgi:hypothetical protein
MVVCALPPVKWPTSSFKPSVPPPPDLIKSADHPGPHHNARSSTIRGVVSRTEDRWAGVLSLTPALICTPTSALLEPAQHIECLEAEEDLRRSILIPAALSDDRLGWCANLRRSHGERRGRAVNGPSRPRPGARRFDPFGTCGLAYEGKPPATPELPVMDIAQTALWCRPTI